jgi:hypothetical protein
VSRLSRIVPAENEGSASAAIETSAQGVRREDVLRAAESPIMGMVRGVLDRLGIGSEDAEMLKRCTYLATNSPAIRWAFEQAGAALRLDLQGQPSEDVPSPALSCATCRYLDMPRQRMPDGRLQFAWRCMLGFRPLQLGHGPAYMLAPGECDRFERWEPGGGTPTQGGRKTLGLLEA